MDGHLKKRPTSVVACRGSVYIHMNTWDWNCRIILCLESDAYTSDWTELLMRSGILRRGITLA